MRRGLVIGCGGTLGAAWTVGALAAVEQALDWDVRTADALVGTSAGAEFVTLLGSGVGVADLVAAHRNSPDARPELVAHLAAAPDQFPPLPRLGLGSLGLALRPGSNPLTRLTGLLPVGTGDAGWLADLVDRLVPGGGWLDHPAAWVVGVDYDTGHRVAFGSPDAPPAPLRDAVRASWAIPGWFPPVTIAGRRYVDGGVASPTSADLVLPLDLDEVVVVAPMASVDPGRANGLSRVERLLRGWMSRRVAEEVATLRAAGVRVLRVDPGPSDLAVMGANFMAAARRRDTLEAALTTCRDTVTARLGDFRPSTMEQEA